MYKVASSTESKSYTVTISPNRCTQRQCIPQCNESECGYLCRHTAQCTCADYIHGHLCKHTYKVHKSYLVRYIDYREIQHLITCSYVYMVLQIFNYYMQVMMILHDTDTTDLEFSHEIEEKSLQMFDVKKEEELIIFPKGQHQVYTCNLE